jgi:hypothetical protein
MSTAKFDTLSNLAGTLTIPVDTVAQGTARAWVNFNGTDTVAIRASFNVSSITDNGTGDYTVNFTNAMVDANYSYLLYADFSPTEARNTTLGYDVSSVGTGSLRYNTYNSSTGSATDFNVCNLAIFR